MAKVAAICMHTPDDAQELLKQLNYPRAKLLGYGRKAKDDPPGSVVFILSFLDFIRNLDKINSEPWSKTTIFLFCPIVNAKDLANTRLLDASASSRDLSTKATYKKFTKFELSDFLDSDFLKKRIYRKNEDFKTFIINNVRTGTFLNLFMTLLYSVALNQHLVLINLITEYLTSNKNSTKTLEQKLEKAYEWGAISSICREKFLDFLRSDLGLLYKDVLNEAIRKKLEGETFNLQSICKKNSVDLIEVKYLLTILIQQKTHFFKV